MKHLLLLCAVVFIAVLAPAHASINPNEIVVVYNSAPQWNTGNRQSKAVADYYCAQRNIPEWNKCALYVDTEYASLRPDAFYDYIVNDQEGSIGLKSFLQQRFGSDPNDAASDPVKCLVLCYGIPMFVNGSERTNSLDSALTLLFNSTEWGYEPLASYGGGGTFQSPYFSTSGTDPANRTTPTDFGSFRQSDTGFTVYAPNFSIVRMLDTSHALAAGTKGVLYSGTLSGSTWQWAAINDLTKQFIDHDVSDICTLDPVQYPDSQYRGYAWVCDSGSGSIIQTTDYGASWSTVRLGTIDALYNDSITGISFYDTSNGWRVGSYYDTSVSPAVLHYCVKRIPDTVPGVKSGLWGNLPSNFIPHSIAAVSASEAWISGSGGIYHTTDGGANWTPQYTTGGTTRIWVKAVSGADKGWAVTANGRVLRTTDGSTWSELTSPTFSGNADLAAYDDNHVVIAYGSGSFLAWDGSNWSTDSSDSSSKTSVAWAGGSDVVACTSGTSVIHWRNSTSWHVTDQIPNATWKQRYLCSRLDAYETPLETVTIDGQQKQIPRDVKRLIDRAMNADQNGRTGIGNWQVVADDSPNWVDQYGNITLRRIYCDEFKGAMRRLVNQNCIDPADTIGSFVTNKNNVICYTSNGSYDGAGDTYTSWWRPFFNTWIDGAIGIYWRVSTDGRNLRSPNFEWLERDSPTQAQSNQVLVHGFRNTAAYSTHQVALYATGNATPYATATFNNGTAVIDLTGITIPTNTTIKLLFPANDGGKHDGETIYSLDQYTHIRDEIAAGRGVSYNCRPNQCLSIDLIRDGCSATAGNVSEPFGTMVPDPEVIMPQYAAGNTWAESAWMGMQYIPWMEVAVGDPLMSPFALRPTVTFSDPTPGNGDKVRGQIALEAAATPTGSIQRVEFWVSGNNQPTRRLGCCYQAPYETIWDSLQTSGGNRVYPNGNYTVQAIAYRSGSDGGPAIVSRSLVLDDSISSVSITNPASDNSVVNSTTQLAAQVSPTAGTTTFWLFGNGDPIQLTGNTVPGSVTDGEYQLQAIAIDHANSPYFSSYSSRRPIRVVDNFASNIGGLGSFADSTTVYLAGTPVVAGSSAAIDYPLTSGHAFYLEDATRYGGIRVVASNSVQAGRNVSVLGVLHVGNGISERYIQATQVWDDGAADVPAALGMINKSLGGKDTDDNNGQTNPGIGNVGLLARIWGTVTYVSATNGFAYIDDGSHVQDGNSLSAVGIRVYFGDLPVPTVGSYLTVTGISSVEMIGGYRERMLRVASSGSDSCSGTVTYVGSDFVYVDDGSHPSDGNEITAPRIVPQDGSSIPAATVGVLGRKVVFGSLAKPGIDDEVSITGVSYYSYADGRPAPMCVSSPSDLTYVDRYIPARSTSSGIVAIDDPYTVLPAGTNVKLTDAHVQGVDTNYFFVRPAGNWPAVSCAVPTALVGGETVTITGQVLSGRDQNGWLHMTPNHIYLGGSTYGAMSVTPQGPATMSVSSLSASSETDGTEGGGPFRPWPGPTAEEILASDSFQQQYCQVGAIGWVLSQSDGTLIDLSAEATSGQWYDNRVFGLREWFEPIPNGPRLYLYLNNPVQVDGLGRDVTIDIVGATLTTLSNGQRALVRPTAVYAYTNQDGMFAPPMPWFKYLQPTTGMRTNSLVDSSSEDIWPWKLKIAP